MKTVTKNCAIYTRKSTDEGLDIDFNTLDAQRESCEAYIASQKAEGWCLFKTPYNDGGFSGGNMDRPGLQALISDIKKGLIQTVVVYKIDRLTRSLMDFAKLVDVFDAHGVTFVSVTQSFNTTTSMGRLTLNVLLSFAQFEREVSAERIRDKVAASKKKGMWMGGNIPLGYDVIDRKLVVNKTDAVMLKTIFEQYLKLGCVSKVKSWLKDNNITSPTRTSKRGRKSGGNSYSRGALYAILKNPIYIGKIRHKDITYDGLHDAIINRDIWDEVQEKLITQATRKRGIKNHPDKSLLKSLLYDCEGNAYTMTHTVQNNKRHHYYISNELAAQKNHPHRNLARLPAREIERVLIDGVNNHICDALGFNTIDYHGITSTINKHRFEKDITTFIKRVTIVDTQISIEMDCDALKQSVEKKIGFGVPTIFNAPVYQCVVPYYMRRGPKGTIIIKPQHDDRDPFDLPNAELKNLVRGVIWSDRHFAGESMRQIAKSENLSEAGVRKIILQSFDRLMTI